ncbi:MAG: acetaldehyde dehydrogenase (acetylating) [Candidatus Magasanikbacteria bacterium]|jgi:acetaldehyde dehydrogenase
MSKIKVGIIGTGNIGTDLLCKIQRSDILECSIFAGRDPESNGIKRAENMGIKTSFDSIHAIEDDPSICEVVFDATSARAHIEHARILKKLGKFVIDITPSRIGKMCIPAINIDQALQSDNVNMVTCGGQASVPIAKAIMEIHPETEYIEVVASISSKSAGLGTRANIDEYTQTTKDAIEIFSGVPKAKAIIILNPAEPPILMSNTIYSKINNPNLEKIKNKILEVEAQIRKYVPGYKISLGPVYENGRLTIMIEVVGVGDYLPEYSGNLDIITCAAVQVAEEYAKRK